MQACLSSPIHDLVSAFGVGAIVVIIIQEVRP